MNTQDKDVLLVEKLYKSRDPRVLDCLNMCSLQTRISNEDIQKVRCGELSLTYEEQETFFSNSNVLVLYDFLVNKITFPPGFSDMFSEMYEDIIGLYDKNEILPTDKDFDFTMKFKYRVIVAISKMIGIEK